MYISRTIENSIHTSLANIPVVAIVGPRQCGKSTTAKVIFDSYDRSNYPDLERPSDLNKLNDPNFIKTVQFPASFFDFKNFNIQITTLLLNNKQL